VALQDASPSRDQTNGHKNASWSPVDNPNRAILNLRCIAVKEFTLNRYPSGPSNIGGQMMTPDRKSVAESFLFRIPCEFIELRKHAVEAARRDLLW
jgi:hypothetical protein